MPQILCPVCDVPIKRSDHLKDVFRDDPVTLEAANLVTHYRHAHLKQYDYAWRNRKDAKTGYAKMEHEDLRMEINNRAKKELAEALVASGRQKVARGLLKLQDNDEETTCAINDALAGKKPQKAVTSNNKKQQKRGKGRK